MPHSTRWLRAGPFCCAPKESISARAPTFREVATDGRTVGPDLLYRQAIRLFAVKTPVVAAVQGAAIGAGFGLACLADFRIACPEARFSANFARFGFHHILGLTVTLPAIVGQQHATICCSPDDGSRGRRPRRSGSAMSWSLATPCAPRHTRWRPRSPHQRHSLCARSARRCGPAASNSFVRPPSTRR